MQANPQQLISAARLLKEAQDLVGDVETIMGGAGYAEIAQRLKEIAVRLRDELHELRQLDGPKAMTADKTAMIAREAPSPKPAPSSDLPKEPLPKTPAKQIPRIWEAVRAGVAMIAKRIVRERGASNFRRLGRYILDGAAEEEQAVMARMADYILGAEKSRAANVRFSNCVSTDAELALKEILATQAMNKRAKGDRTYHLVISFPPGERPTLSQLEDIERVLCERIGLGGHQRLSATHLDTGHFHLHVAINKIHPESFRCIEPYYDKRRLMQACVELEAKHGLIPHRPWRGLECARGDAHRAPDHAGSASIEHPAEGPARPVLRRGKSCIAFSATMVSN